MGGKVRKIRHGERKRNGYVNGIESYIVGNQPKDYSRRWETT